MPAERIDICDIFRRGARFLDTQRTRQRHFRTRRAQPGKGDRRHALMALQIAQETPYSGKLARAGCAHIAFHGAGR